MADVRLEVNGQSIERSVEPRMLLSDFIRHDLGLTGTHVGCEQGVCGACTIQVDGLAVRSCLMLTVQADGCTVRTVEDLTSDVPDGSLDAVQEAFRDCHGLQCGFCTPGFLMTIDSALARGENITADDLLSGNLCRCTGYQGIRAAVEGLLEAARDARAVGPDDSSADR